MIALRVGPFPFGPRCNRAAIGRCRSSVNLQEVAIMRNPDGPDFSFLAFALMVAVFGLGLMIFGT